MDIETRLTNLENLVNGLIKNMNQHNLYVDADINGCRQGIAEVTPWTDTETAYIGDTEVVFSDVPAGNMNIYFDVHDGSYRPTFSVERVADVVIVSFDELEIPATVTLSII